MQADKKICFVISPIGEEESETRKRSDVVLRHIICASVEQLGYEVIRADKISEPGIITTQIIQHIVDAELVIADLTEKNPNVFYELALRHAIRKPLVQLIKKGEVIPFDVAATRIIQFDITDLDSVDAAKTEILSQIRSLEAGRSEVHNPISVSLDLKMLKESGSAEERSLADIVEAISDLRVAVTSVDKRMNNSEAVQSAKLLEEFKVMIDTLSGKIERQRDTDVRRSKWKYHSIIFEEMMHMEATIEDPGLGFLMLVSLLKDDFPWIYEIGLETYKGLKSNPSQPEKEKLAQSFENALEALSHPIMREIYGKSEDMYMFSKDIKHFMRRYLGRYLRNNGE